MNSSTLPALLIFPPGNALFNISNTFGAAYIGSAASLALLGATSLQAWFYYNSFPKDPIWMKLMVVIVWIVEVLRSSFTAHAAYYYLVLNWGNIAGLNVIHWHSLVIMTHIGEILGHFYFAWRIYMLSRNTTRYALTSLVVILALWDFGMATATYLDLKRAASLMAYTGGVLAPFALATSIATDVAVAASLVHVLNRSRTGFNKTNRLINTLIFYSIQIGMITVVADALCIALNQYISKLGFDYMTVYAVIGNLYANSLLASLNSRSALRDNSGSTGGISFASGIASNRGGSSNAQPDLGSSGIPAYSIELMSFNRERSSAEDIKPGATATAVDPMHVV